MQPLTLLPDDERRRSRRVAVHTPLTLRWKESAHEGLTAVINDHGAMVLSPFTCPKGSVLEVENPATRRSARARVVWGWFGDARSERRFRLGLEFVESRPGFWGQEYEAVARDRSTPVRQASGAAAARP